MHNMMRTPLNIIRRRCRRTYPTYRSIVQISSSIHNGTRKDISKESEKEKSRGSGRIAKNIAYQVQSMESKGSKNQSSNISTGPKSFSKIYREEIPFEALREEETDLLWKRIDGYIYRKCAIKSFTGFYPKGDIHSVEDLDKLYRIMILVLSHNTNSPKEVNLVMNALATNKGITRESLSMTLLHYDAIYGNSSENTYERFFKIMKRIMQIIKKEYDNVIPATELEFFSLYPSALELIEGFENEEYAPPKSARYSLDYNSFNTNRAPLTWKMLDALARRKFDSVNYKEKFSGTVDSINSQSTYTEMRDVRYQQLLLLFLSNHCRTRQSAIDILEETLQKMKVQRSLDGNNDTDFILRISPFSIMDNLELLLSAMNNHAVPNAKRIVSSIREFTKAIITLHDQDIPLTLEAIRYNISPVIARELKTERDTVFKYPRSRSFDDILNLGNKSRPNQNTTASTLFYPKYYTTADTEFKVSVDEKALLTPLIDNLKINKESRRGLGAQYFEIGSDPFSKESLSISNKTKSSLWYYIDNADIIKAAGINHADLVNLTTPLTANEVRFHRLLFICLSTKFDAKVIMEGFKCMGAFLKINSGNGLTIQAIADAPETKFLSLNFPHANVITRLVKHLAVIIEDFYNGEIPESQYCMKKLGLVINERKQLTSRDLGRSYYEQIFNPKYNGIPPYRRTQLQQPKILSTFVEPPLKQPWITIERISDSKNIPSLTHPSSASKSLTQRETFTVFTFNALADIFWKSSYKDITNSTFHNELENRSEMYRNILGYYRPDIICLQEIPRSMYVRFWVRTLAEMGYIGIFQEKGTRDQEVVSDGIATFYKLGRFELLNKAVIFLNKENKLFKKYLQDDESKVEIYKRYLGKPHVALLVELRDLNTNAKLSVVNTHLVAGSENRDVRFIQSHTLMTHIEKRTKANVKEGRGFGPGHSLEDKGLDYTHFADTPLIICGDLNTNENSIITELLSTGTVNRETRGLTKVFGEGTVTESVQQPHVLTSGYSYIDHPPTMYHNNEALATVDYIWYSSNRFKLKGLLGAPKDFYLQKEIRLPNSENPSDHVPLMCEFALS